MIALGLVHVIERHSDEVAAELIAKPETSSRTSDLRKLPVEELRRGIQEILGHSESGCSPRRATTSRSAILNSVRAARLRGSPFPTSAGQLL
jgi:hypothetical protein